jgi:DNA invertase Pin-like site-specific DNA recombinase
MDQMRPRRTKIIGYYRTSTDDQRLGIEAQQATLARIAAERGCEIVRTFVEHESGGDNTRVELDKAMRHARRIAATLVVAKLDRLSRDSNFLMKLYDGDVPLIFGDLPEIDGSAASRFMVQVMANMAEFERRRIGERTKEALAELKKKGVKLGTPANLTQEARLKGAKASARKRVARAIDEQSDIAEVAVKLRADGQSLRQIAAHLNEEGYVSRKGASWAPTQVWRILKRLPKSPPLTPP